MGKDSWKDRIVEQITEGQIYSPGEQVIWQVDGAMMNHSHSKNDKSTHADAYVSTKQENGSWNHEKMHSDDD